MKKKRFLGPAFSGELAKVADKPWDYFGKQNKIGHFKKKEPDWTDTLLPHFESNLADRFRQSPWRITAFYIFSLILFFIIFVRLFHLQIIEGKRNRDLADGNRIQIKVIHAPRGVIYDRSGVILAANSPAFRLFDPSIKKAKLISREEALELEVKNDPKAADLEVDNVRTYPMGEKLAHVIGYVGEISEDQLKRAEGQEKVFSPGKKSYRAGDRVGQSGIEAQYEEDLKGIDGGEIIEIDSFGKKLRTLRKDSPIPGQNIYLTIDASLQEKAYQVLNESLAKQGSCCAAAAALDPLNGQVLALVSLPSFNPNAFTNLQDEGAISEIFSHPHSPILNRVIAGTYPPGSTFKIVSALAALSSNKIKEATTIQDNGVVYLGTFKFTNWYFTQYGKTEGSVNLLKALQRSNDTYFYEIGRIIGEQQLVEWSEKLNLGEKLGIDLPGEEKGLVPTDAWKRKTYGQVWYPGDTLHMAIGQGFVLTTPLQVLGMTSFIAGNGNLFKPQLILTDFKPKILVSNLVSLGHIQSIKEGLDLVPKIGGTAWPFFAFPIETAGKTGTAEYGDPKGKTHAWYTSYAPSNDPKIALTVLVEGGGEGSSVAAPIAKEIYRWYFSEDKNKLIQDIYTPATQSAEILEE